MKTKVYTLKNGVVSFNGISENLDRNPQIILFCFDAMQTKQQVLDMFFLKDAEVKLYASYDITMQERSETPNYFTYEIAPK